jgi:ABC-type polysaccharide/polyol phosphate export permease
MAGFWTLPVIWDYKIIYEGYEFMLYNPLTAFVVNVRQVTLHDQTPDLKYMLFGIAVSILLAISGYFFMKYKSKKALEFL